MTDIPEIADQRKAFFLAIASSKFLSPTAIDSRGREAYEQALHEVRQDVKPLIEASRRAEVLSVADLVLQVGKAHQRFGMWSTTP